jgi:hypothetical protein
MNSFDVGTGIFCLVIAAILIFLMVGPSRLISKVLATIGNFIQNIVGWIKSKFTK